MTVRKDLIIRCDGCREESVYSQSALRSSTLKSILENAGFVTESNGIAGSNDHYCPDCNDREKATYYVSDGRGEEYLGEIEAWGIVDARRVAWDTFGQENMVKREKEAAT